MAAAVEAPLGDLGEVPKQKHALQIVESHMPSGKEKSAIEIAIAAVEGNSQLMDIASHIKTHYDKQYPGSGKATEGVYHAMCGTHFASASLPPCPGGGQPAPCSAPWDRTCCTRAPSRRMQW